jgi:hypothetical protein
MARESFPRGIHVSAKYSTPAGARGLGLGSLSLRSGGTKQPVGRAHSPEIAPYSSFRTAAGWRWRSLEVGK